MSRGEQGLERTASIRTISQQADRIVAREVERGEEGETKKKEKEKGYLLWIILWPLNGLGEDIHEQEILGTCTYTQMLRNVQMLLDKYNAKGQHIFLSFYLRPKAKQVLQPLFSRPLKVKKLM